LSARAKLSLLLCRLHLPNPILSNTYPGGVGRVPASRTADTPLTATPRVILLRLRDLRGRVPLPAVRANNDMAPSSERRHLERYRLRIPLRFRTINLAGDKSEHFTEALNVSRGGFFFVTSAPLQVGMPIEATIKMPPEVTGGKSDETHCKARVVHAKADSYSDGRMGFGAEIEAYIEPEKPKMPGPELVKPPAPKKS
jgi:hypothetical protein